jgi:hypothetical protein
MADSMHTAAIMNDKMDGNPDAIAGSVPLRTGGEDHGNRREIARLGSIFVLIAQKPQIFYGDDCSGGTSRDPNSC